MIEYLLLFALGFFVAVLAGLLVAPTIHRRIVKLTEERMRATVPLAAAEVRAQKDQARAAYAAENSRIAIELKEEREKLMGARAKTETLTRDIAELAGTNQQLSSSIAELNTQAADLRAEIRQKTMQLDDLSTAHAKAERDIESRDLQIASMTDNLNRLMSDLEGLRIDIATRETESESLKSQIATVRDERNTLRDNAKSSAAKMRDLQLELQKEGNRGKSLEGKLTTAATKLTDRENALERRSAEIKRLKERLKSKPASAASAPRHTANKSTASSVKSGASNGKSYPVSTEIPKVSEPEKKSPEIASRIDELRAHQIALVDSLNNSKSPSRDDALRREIAQVAAMMVELTAQREGDTSPIHKLVSTSQGQDGSLSARIQELMADDRRT